MNAPRRLTRTWAVVGLVLLAGCSGQEDPDGPADSRTPAAVSTSPEGTPTTEAPANTFADVGEPATVPLRADRVPGFEAIRAWEGSDVSGETGSVAAELFLSPGRSLVVLPNSFDGLSARESSEAEMEYWREHNVFTEGPTKVMDPVVVDGVEMLHARGEGPLGLVDWFVRATGDLTVEVLFTMPADLSEEERETYVGQVMATVELE